MPTNLELAAEFETSARPRAAAAAHPLVARAMRRIAEDVEVSPCLDALAAELRTSKSYLVRRFHREIGLTPGRYLMHVRVARARALLAAGLRIAEVAVEVGFCDESHLSRWFKRIHGETPGQFARGQRGRGA